MESANILLVLKAVDNASKVITGVDRSIDNFATKSGARMTAFGASMTAAVTLPLIGLGAIATKTAFDFDRQSTAASRALNLTGTQLTAFKTEVLDLAPKIGLLPTKLTELATEAGKLGVARNQVLSFAQTIQKVAVATDTSTIELTKQGAAIQAVYGGGQKELEKFFAAVNQLDDSVGGTATSITDFVQRTAGVGKVAGFNTQQLAALGATFNKLGFESERAARASSSLFIKLRSIGTITKGGREALQKYGFDIQQIQADMAKDPQQGFINFLTKVNTLSKEGQLEVLKKVGGADFAPLFASLAGSMGEYQRALQLAGGDQANLTKLNSEFAKQQQSTAGQMMIFQATLQKLGITVGAAILPAVNSLLQAITPVVNKFAAFAQAHPGILKIGLMIAGVVAIAFPLIGIIGSIISGIGAVIGFIATIGAGLGVLSATFGVLGSIFALITSGGLGLTATAILINGLMGILAPVAPLLNVLIGIFGRLAGVVKIFSLALTFLAANPIILVMTAIGALIGISIALYQNWEPFRSFVNNLWSGVVAAFHWGVAQVQISLSLIPQLFESLIANSGNWGLALINTFIQGIFRGLPNLESALSQIMAWVRSFFPSSPAKRGALSDLDTTGSALVNTFAGGIDPGLVTGAINNLAVASTPESSTGLTNNNTTNQGGSKQINLYFSPTIQGGASINIIDQLRPFAQEIVRMLSETDSRMSRANY